MEQSILDELGKRYIGDPKTVGLPDSVYSDVLRFDAEEFSQKTMKKRYLVSMTLGEKYDIVANTVVNQVRLLVNVVGFLLLALSIVLIATNVGSLGASAFQAATGGLQGSNKAMTPEQEQLQLLQQLQGK